MISPARREAYRVLCRVEMGGEFSDNLLNSRAVSALDERDRNFATEVCLGTLRWQLSLDDVLARYSSRPWQNLDAQVRVLLRLSFYQLWRSDRVPDHAVLNDAVEIGKTELDVGKAGFINGLLRSLCRERPWEKEDFQQGRPEFVRASLPEWLWSRWSARFGSERAFHYALSLNQPPQRAIWEHNPGDSPRTGVAFGAPSEIVPGARLVAKTTRNGHYWIQDEASQLIPHLLGSASGWRIWDACASPGGKSAILARMTGERGLVVASDLRCSRLKQMKIALASLGGKRPVILAADAEAEYPFRGGTFDAVLADVPCSGLGTVRRNPEIKWRFPPERFPSLKRRQLAILKSVAGAVRTGGVLLYSTCSTEPDENEDVVEAFLSSTPHFRSCRPDHHRV
jgi:16S rRNA (cytosine967-C5)-methyltransferase